MSRKITFKLHGFEEQIALAFQRHCNVELGLKGDLNHFIKQQFLRFLIDNVDRNTANESRTADNSGDSSPAAEQSDGVASAPLADSSGGGGAG